MAGKCAWAVRIGVLAIAALTGCDGGNTTTTGGDAGAGGGGGGGAPEGGGGSGTTTTSTASMSTTTTTTVDPCAGEIEGFMPEWKPSEGLHQGVCDQAQIDGFFTACVLPGSTQAACDTFGMANGPCVQCAVSAPDDATYGPMTLYPDQKLIYENPGQCVSEIEMDPSDSSCGAKVFTVIQCAVSACAQCTDVDFNTLLACLNAAEAGDCKPHADERDACLADLMTQGIDVTQCFQGNADFSTYLKSLTLLFCGP